MYFADRTWLAHEQRSHLATSSAMRMSAEVRHKLPGWLALNVVTVIWGSQHAVIKQLVLSTASADGGAPTLINAFRFGMAAVTTGTLSLVRHFSGCEAKAGASGLKAATRPPSLLRAAAELSLWQVIGFTLQLVGLQWTSASRSAFLLYLNAVLVPFLSTLLGERRIGLRTWVAAVVAVTGTLLLTYDGGPPNVGDVWSLGAAAASAMYIVRLGALAADCDAPRLSAVTLAITTVACTALPLAQAAAGGGDGGGAASWLGLARQAGALLHDGWAALLYLSVFVTATANLLQMVGQQRVGSAEAAIIYTMDPVYGALFAWLLLGEQLHAQGYAGVALVVAANLLRRLPWAAVNATRRLLTPFPSSADLAAMGPAKCEPLLGKGQAAGGSSGQE